MTISKLIALRKAIIILVKAKIKEILEKCPEVESNHRHVAKEEVNNIIKRLINRLRYLKYKFFFKRKHYEELIEYFTTPPKGNIEGFNISPDRYANKELNVRSEYVYKFIKDYIHHETKILELGCGVGRNLSFLRKKGLNNLFGIDINQEAIASSTEIYSNLVHLKNNFLCSSLEQGLQNYKDNDFNLVFSFSTLMHIHPKVEEKVFNQISRITKDYLLTIEMEDSLSHVAHFPRNYKKELEFRNFIQREVIYPNNNTNPMLSNLTFRLFEKI